MLKIILMGALQSSANISANLLTHFPLTRIWGAGTGNNTINSDGIARSDSRNKKPAGKVWLVGAGPGDPELVSVKALRVIRSADVLVYDRLVCPELIAESPRDAIRIDVGKRPGHHPVPQGRIEEILCAHAAQGRTVVRLKGGDPFIFGRGGEEMLSIKSAGIAVEIIPGITAAAACAATSGFPLTHRDIADKVTLVTAHYKDERDRTDWRALASDGSGTLVFYMGLSSANSIQQQLIKNGLDPQTPAALVENGSTAVQRTVYCSLNTLSETVIEKQLISPCLIVVGKVVALAGSTGETLQQSQLLNKKRINYSI
ncbi:MAG: uroporphyrinogen-III C-methyltransferase [Pseudohongiella sp.]|nr:uroporphyrinogen-III C-methyltransferase [Pseudohongiella sp.]